MSAVEADDREVSTQEFLPRILPRIFIFRALTVLRKYVS